MKINELVNVIKSFRNVCPFGAPDLSDPIAASIYFEHFKEWPRDRLIETLSRLTTAGRFPSIDEIKRAGGDVSALEPSFKAQATEIAQRIWGSLGLDGSYNPERAKQRIGPVGWEAVQRMGGWQQLCEITQEDDKGTCIAQWRDMIEGILMSGGKRFGMEQLPSADKPSLLTKALEITEKGDDETTEPE